MSEMKFSFLDKAINQLAIQALEMDVDYGYLIIVSRDRCSPKENSHLLKLKD